jgi:putative transposase
VPDHKINGKQHYLWRAVDQDGEVVEVYLQTIIGT